MRCADGVVEYLEHLPEAPDGAYGFSPQSVSFAYTIVIAMIGLSGPIGGWLQRKAPEHIIMTVAGIGFGLGWFLTGFASTIRCYTYRSACW